MLAVGYWISMSEKKCRFLFCLECEDHYDWDCCLNEIMMLFVRLLNDLHQSPMSPLLSRGTVESLFVDWKKDEDEQSYCWDKNRSLEQCLCVFKKKRHPMLSSFYWRSSSYKNKIGRTRRNQWHWHWCCYRFFFIERRRLREAYERQRERTSGPYSITQIEKVRFSFFFFHTNSMNNETYLIIKIHPWIIRYDIFRRTTVDLIDHQWESNIDRHRVSLSLVRIAVNANNRWFL